MFESYFFLLAAKGSAKIVKRFHAVSNDQLMVEYEVKDGFQPDKETNAVLGAFVTCYGRMVLFSILNK